MAGKSLKSQTANGLFWGGLSNGLQQVLNLVFGICLARLLTPADYGMVGMLTIFSAIAGTLQESGFIAALINKKRVRSRDYNAVFWFCFLMSVTLYGVLFCCAPLIARFYHTPQLVPLSRLAFLGFVMASLAAVPAAYIAKHLLIRQKAMVGIASLVVSGILGISLAANGFSYWGIAIQNVCYITLSTSGYWFICRWRPSFRFDFGPICEMYRFSSKLLITGIFTHVNNNLFAVILGKCYSSREVGFYNQANKWSLMGAQLINGMMTGVAQPVFVSVADDRERHKQVFRKLLRFTAFVSFPALFGLALIAPEFITIAITDKWLPSVPILQQLCVAAAFVPLTTLFSNLVISKGASDVHMYTTLALDVLVLAVVLLLYRYGISVMVSGYVVTNVAWLFVWQHFAYREIKLGVWEMLRDLAPYLLTSVLSVVAAHFAAQQVGGIYWVLVCKIVVCAALYVGLLALCGSQILHETLTFIRKKQV